VRWSNPAYAPRVRVRIATLWGALLLIPIAFGQARTNDFPDTPQNHWGYESIADLQSEGVLVGYPDGLGRGVRPSARYETAVGVNAAYVRFHGIAEGLSLLGKRKLSRDEVRWNTGKLRVGKKLVTLIEYFKLELKNLGCIPDEMTADIRKDILAIGLLQPEASRISEPFSDVKPTHWASDAVRNLWVEGILRGYPDGKFGG